MDFQNKLDCRRYELLCEDGVALLRIADVSAGDDDALFVCTAANALGAAATACQLVVEGKTLGPKQTAAL